MLFSDDRSLSTVRASLALLVAFGCGCWRRAPEPVSSASLDEALGALAIHAATNIGVTTNATGDFVYAQATGGERPPFEIRFERDGGAFRVERRDLGGGLSLRP